LNQSVNNNLVLIVGTSGAGKSASFRNLKDPAGVAFMNCESGKELPFPAKFMKATVTDPLQILQAFDALEADKKIHTIIVDTITFMMDMYESKKVLKMQNKMQGWSDYAQFFKELMQDKVASSSKNVLMTAHTLNILNEDQGIVETMVKVKGSLMNQGIESYFCNVLAAKKMPLTKLEKYSNKLLTITPEEEALGFKYVFQTRLTKETVHERIRGPIGLWSVDETFIDNDCQLVLDRLHDYYK